MSGCANLISAITGYSHLMFAPVIHILRLSLLALWKVEQPNLNAEQMIMSAVNKDSVVWNIGGKDKWVEDPGLSLDSMNKSCWIIFTSGRLIRMDVGNSSLISVFLPLKSYPQCHYSWVSWIQKSSALLIHIIAIKINSCWLWYSGTVGMRAT